MAGMVAVADNWMIDVWKFIPLIALVDALGTPWQLLRSASRPACNRQRATYRQCMQTTKLCTYSDFRCMLIKSTNMLNQKQTNEWNDLQTTSSTQQMSE